jgi:hypothetical protein
MPQGDIVDPTTDNHRQLAVRIAESSTTAEKEALRRWIEQLLTVRDADISVVEKAKQAVAITTESTVIVPVVKMISRELTPPQLTLLTQELLVIKDSDRSLSDKLSEGTATTIKYLKQFAWDDRGLVGRMALGGAIVGAVLFGGQAAGIAALGTAIGVPLWVVFGAGAAFLGVLYEEITGVRQDPKASYTVIDAERKDTKETSNATLPKEVK